MPIIASIDGPNRLIHLHSDTVGTTLHPIDIYKEMRTLRRSTESLRKYDRFLDSAGNVAKGGGKFTERYVVEKFGTRIVPFDTSQELTINGTIITDDGQEGIACFDRTPLSPTTVVDINYIPPQVEIITVNTGSAVTAQNILDIADQVWNENTADHVGVGTTGEAIAAPSVDVQAIVDGVLDEDITTHQGANSVGKAITDGDATAITVDNAAIADAVWSENVADHVAGGTAAAALLTGFGLTVEDIVDGVWDESMNGHTLPTSAGFYMANGLVASTDNAAIAAAVWDALIASHVTAGTFGLVLQNGTTPAAIAAAVTADMDLNSNLLSVIRTAVETDIPVTLAGLNDFNPATDTVALVDTVSTNSDMRGTDFTLTDLTDLLPLVTALHAIEFNARRYDKALQKVIVHDGALLTDATLYEWNTTTSAVLTTLEPV